MKTINFKYLALCFGLFFFTCSDDDSACTEQVYYQDFDGDGEGSRTEFTSSCNALTGFVTNALDPNDNNSGITSASIWDGPTVTFTKANNADWTMVANQDVITPGVAITRANNEGLFNIVSENSFNSSTSPAGTLWAEGTLADLSNLEFENWRDAVNSSPPNSVGRTYVVFLTAEQIYIQLTFNSWTSNSNGGGFSYTRTTQP